MNDYEFDALADSALKAVGDDVKKSIEQQSYENEYIILEDWFEQQKGHWSESTVRLGGLMIYGWMPTILRAEGRGEKRRSVDFAKVASRLNAGEVTKEDHDFLNGSVVGTSKFLHFWKPSEYAIWDSRIHDYLGWPGTTNSKRLYQTYLEKIRTFVKARSLELREVEVALFRQKEN